MILLFILILAYFIWSDINLGSSSQIDENVEFSNPEVKLMDDHAIIKHNGETKKLSRRCPHAGCNVNYNKDSNEFVCPCHQSKFNLQGKVLQGPAESNLAPY